MSEHVILVAFTVEAESAKEAQEYLMKHLPRPGARPDPNARLEEWWVAEDERYDRSDNDSAVFVPKGVQPEARGLLLATGLAVEW